MEKSDKPVCPSPLYSARAEIVLRNGAEICTTYLSISHSSGFEPDLEYCFNCKYNPNNIIGRLREDVATRQDLSDAQKKAATDLGSNVASLFANVENVLRRVKDVK